MTIEWQFSNNQTFGNRIVSAGFEAAPDLIIGVPGQFTRELEFVGPGYELEETLLCPTLQSGLVIVHFACDVVTDAADVAMDYGGVSLTVAGELIQTTGTDRFHGVAYGWLGPTEELEDRVLTITLTVAADVDMAATILFVEGIAQGTPDILEAGTVDVFARTLELDPEPSLEKPFLFTGAAQGIDGGSSLLTVLSPNYVAANEQVSTTLVTTLAAWSIGDVQYNCECDVDPDARTLEDMRTDTLALTGYAAQATNPPPGIERMYNGFINLAQRHVYAKCRSMNTERFFTWQLVPGRRYYGLRDNTNLCAVKLNRYKITGGWCQDLNNVWWPLTYGIDPTGYTLDTNFGWPTNFVVRDCLEVFPAPQAAYTIRILGHIQLLPLEEDDDTTTIPSTPVLNYSIFLAKSHKGMKDAEIYAAMADAGISEIIAGKHATRRYIPGVAAIPVATPPVMVRFDN